MTIGQVLESGEALIWFTCEISLIKQMNHLFVASLFEMINNRLDNEASKGLFRAVPSIHRSPGCYSR
jgi:hypothetical protein